MPVRQRLAISFHSRSNRSRLSSKAWSWRSRSRCDSAAYCSSIWRSKRRAFVLDFAERPVAPGGQIGQPLGVRGVGLLQVLLPALFDSRHGGGEDFVGLLGLGLVAGDDRGVETLTFGLGRLEHGGVSQSGLEHRAAQRQIGRDGSALGDAGSPHAGHKADQTADAAAAAAQRQSIHFQLKDGQPPDRPPGAKAARRIPNGRSP